MQLIRDKPFSITVGQKQVRLRIPAQLSLASQRFEGGIFSGGDTISFVPLTNDAFAVRVDPDSTRKVYAQGGRMFFYVPRSIVESYHLRTHRQYEAWIHNGEFIVKVIT